MVFRRAFVEWRHDLLDSGTYSTAYFLVLLYFCMFLHLSGSTQSLDRRKEDHGGNSVIPEAGTSVNPDDPNPDKSSKLKHSQ